jgi:murein DD-endopeptidase MepM/ murein hydrolase activator NlpD
LRTILSQLSTTLRASRGGAVASILVVASLTLGQAGRSVRAPLHLAIPNRGLSRSGDQFTPALGSACPVGTLPDGDACVRIPEDPSGEPRSGPEEAPEANAHFDRHRRWVIYDQIPRRPERPADYDAYRYPVPCAHSCVVSGYDLDRPDESQRRGKRLVYVGHGAVDMAQPKGTPITFVQLEHEEGDAQVVFVGPLFGTTIIARVTLREGGRLRDYILLFGHLDAAGPGLGAGAHIREGDLVGTVGDTGSPELVHLHLEARRVRDGVDVAKLPPSAMIANENSIVCDPRNILPLR